MPNKCSVPGCSGRGGFSFPSDPERRIKWRDAIKKTSWNPSAYSTVCESHFKPDDFTDTITAEQPISVRRRRRDLKPTAVPSIFSWSAIDVKPVANDWDNPESAHIQV